MTRIEKALVLAFVAVIATRLLLPAPLHLPFGHLILFLAPATAALLAARAALRGARGARPTWVLLALAASGVALGQIIWAFRQLVLQQPMPFPSASFYLFIAFHPLFALGLVASLRAGDRTDSRRHMVHDALLACSAIALSLLRFVYEPLRASRPWLTDAEVAWMVGGQFVAQLSLVAAAMILVWQRTVLPPRATAAIVLVAAANGIANLLQIGRLDPNAGSPGDVFDLIWLVGWVLLATAAAAGGTVRAAAWTGRSAGWLTRRLRQGIALIVATVMTVIALDVAVRGGVHRETLVVLGVLGVLLTLRLAGTLGATERESRNQRELARTRVLVDLSRTLAAAPQVESALRHVAVSALKLLHGERAWLERLEAGGMVRMIPGTAGEDWQVPVQRSCGGWLGERRVDQGLTGHDLWVYGPDGMEVADRVWLAAATVRFGDRAGGTLVVERGDRGFDAGELELLGALADQAAVALENARLLEEARQAERVRLRSEKLAGLGQLAAGVAHEINNPLAAIHSAASTLAAEGEKEDGGDRHDVVEIIRTEAKRAARIVRGMLDFVHPPEVSVQPVDVGAVVRDVIASRAPVHERQGITTVLDLAELPQVLADRGPMEQVFLNLITNAEHALALAAGERTLRVHGRAEEATVAIHVHDTGAGIRAEHIGRVFDPFFTTKPVGEGTGLGLSMSYGIVRELGGSINVESAPGRGTTFTVRLPTATPAHAGPAPEPERCPAAQRPLRLLLVDDEPSIRLLVSRFLRRRGHEVETADNGRAAVDAIAARTFDLILTDLKMPVMDGEALYEHLASVNPEMASRLVFVSGDTVAEATRDFLLRTGLPFISKPFDLEFLARHVVELAAAHEACCAGHSPAVRPSSA